MAISSGKYAKFISDRSGQEFPYSEMVIEWNGSRVHISEFEKKHPQLEPKPHSADAQGLLNARPARTEFPVQDILPNNPFTTTAASGTLSVSYPFNQINYGTSYVRFQAVKKPVGGVAVSTLQLETTLNGNISDSATTIILTNATEFPTSGFIMIEKVDTTPDTDNYGKFLNEVINNARPTIFWKEKDIVKQQIIKWSQNKLHEFIFDLNKLEYYLKKNTTNSINILTDFIIQKTTN